MTRAAEVSERATCDVPINGDVPDVPAVEANNDGLFCGTAGGTCDVPDVPEAPPDVTDMVDNAALPELSIPADQRPRFEVLDVKTKLKERDKPLRAGVWFFGAKAGKKDDAAPTLTQTWVCAPLHIEAQTADGNDNSYGRLLRFRTTRGAWRVWACPMRLLSGSGEEMRGELFDMGLLVDPNNRQLLNKYLCAITPKKRVRCTTQTGWCDGAFVLPGEVIGPNADDVIYQGGRDGGEFGTSGTLESWREHVAAYAIGNPLVTLAIAAAFAGPILDRCHAESGGVHFTGHSSSGKTTSLEAVVSVWGAPSNRGSWRATANGLEGASALHNDGLLALDEIHEADPREVGAVVYMVCNGKGKQRAGKSGNARPVTTWRCVLLSSGERTLATTLAEAGQRQTAGQGVRLLDIPVPDTAQGVFENLHGYASGRELSDALKTAVSQHYGTAIRAFLERYTRDEDDMAAALEQARGMILTADMDGQEKRVAGRFALFGLAGELATAYGITGWPEGAAIAAARTGFAAWRGLRGKGRDETRQVIETLAQFIERHGDSRFSPDGHKAIVRDRAGWWTDDPTQGRVYLFNSSGLREALRGFDFRRSLDTLERCGVIPKAPASGERARPLQVDGQKARVYTIVADALGATREHS